MRKYILKHPEQGPNAENENQEEVAEGEDWVEEQEGEGLADVLTDE